MLILVLREGGVTMSATRCVCIGSEHKDIKISVPELNWTKTRKSHKLMDVLQLRNYD